MNEVNARGAWLQLLGWVTVFGRVGPYTISDCNQPTRSTQPCIPPGSLNRLRTSFDWGKGVNVTWGVTY